jgi:hypothetical protein
MASRKTGTDAFTCSEPWNAYVRCKVGAEMGSEWVGEGYICGTCSLLHSSL